MKQINNNRSAALTQSDKDLIIALADDYLNIYCIRPEEDLVDVIKLDGYKVEGIDSKWDNLCYSKLLRTYTDTRVMSEDRTHFWKDCCREHIINDLSTKALFNGKYRIMENGEIHHYNYKYVKVSSPGEPLRVVGAFRNIDELEYKGQEKMLQLEHFKRIMASNRIGTWNLYVVGDKKLLQPGSQMKEIMGLSANAELSQEEYCEMLESRVHPADRYIFEKYFTQLAGGEHAECTYRWEHPTKGLRYMRCGGVAVPSEDGILHLNGYHYDVTAQITKEIRSNHIIKSFAQTYEFINYINLDDDSFITYTEKEIDDDSMIKVLMAGRASKAISIGIEEIVADEYKDAVAAFSDLSTISERMTNRNVIVSEFKDVNDVWYESSFTIAERRTDGSIRHVLWAIRHIDDEKQIELRKQKILEDNIAANKAKTKFLQNMSHEIRTPLNAMFGFSQLLGLPDGSLTQEDKDQYNAYVYNSYNMLEMLISDIIDIADSEHGNYRIELSEVTVNTVCQNAMVSAEYRVPANVRLYFTSDFPDDYTITSDGRRIQQVLINYLTNACKNTQKGEIHLHCSKTEHPGKITFSVTDTGKGVPKAKADVIFNRFTKLNQYVQGSGLGLNICQTIANKLNGEVYLDTSYTNGARFVFVIDDKKDEME